MEPPGVKLYPPYPRDGLVQDSNLTILSVSLMRCSLAHRLTRLISLGMLCGEFNRTLNCWTTRVTSTSFPGSKSDGWNHFLNSRCDLKLGSRDVKSSKDENKRNSIFARCTPTWRITSCLANVGVSRHNVQIMRTEFWNRPDSLRHGST